MNRNLFLFTTNYPYGAGETFLHTELMYLAKEIDNITIIPLFGTGKTRKMPENVHLLAPLLGFSPKKKSKLIIAGIFNFSPVFTFVPEFFAKKVYSSTTKIWNYFTSLLLFRTIFANLKVEPSENDIFYFYWGDKSALMAPFVKKFGIKTVVRFHGSDLYEETRGGYIPFRKSVFRNTDLALTISENGKKYLNEKYRENAPKNRVVSRLGVEKSGSNPEAQNAYFQLLSCSNVIPVKRVEMIAQALHHLRFNVHWTHIGDGMNMQNLKNEITSLPENVQVTFTGALPHHEIMELYATRHFDLFVNVSESEGIPVSIMEAFSFGIPAIATDVGGTSEIVDKHVGLLVAKAITPAELAAIISAFHSVPDRTWWRKNAVERWDEKYNAKRNYYELCKLFSQI